MKRNYDFSKGTVIKGPVKSRSQLEKNIDEDQKVLTSIRLDREVVEVAKKCAEQEGLGYLTWLNRKLRMVLLNEIGVLERVERLEKAVFKKKA